MCRNTGARKTVIASETGLYYAEGESVKLKIYIPLTALAVRLRAVIIKLKFK